ncbi:hypothetical protein [Runella zeae]|uniref:hypothetical protein n=1 Tax=Runella zeae TaxID=94255 RepID=UPI000491C220|nr:hypothetical protein [Runella zeae]
MKRLKFLFIAFILLVLNVSTTLAQCAMCKGAVETNMSTGRNVIGNGINAGIAYLFVFPYLTVGVIAFLWYRSSKKELAKKLAIQARVKEALR